MTLLSLLDRCRSDQVVWISEDPDAADGIYFGEAGNIRVFLARNYEVISVYPEKFPAVFDGYHGLSIIVKCHE
ncbi:MAG: hypothetical protein Q4F31_09310 [Eubacteriales bacterium]|nr:hypothetical protein [Eubacteriales bacterium]